jgi:hypothetical protein
MSSYDVSHRFSCSLHGGRIAPARAIIPFA